MFGLFKKTTSADSIGESWANAVFAAHSRLQSHIPQCGVSPQKVFRELIYLDTFIFEQVVNGVFTTLAIQQRVLNAYSARLVFGHLEESAEPFQREYDERSSSFGVGWSAPPDYQASMYVAGEICRRCGSMDYELLMFFATQVPRSYATALGLLQKAATETKIV